MKKQHLVIPLVLALLLLLPACGGAAGGAPEEAGPDTPPAGEGSGSSLAEDEEPVYLTCRIIDGAEDGALLLAALDAPLSGGREGLHDGQSVYRLTLEEDIPVRLDGEPAGAGDLRDGMPVEIAFSGTVLETFPAGLGEVYEISGFSIGAPQNPGGSLYDLCGLYLQALDDLWSKDPALNEDISLAGLDLSQAPGGLLESEQAALAWRFGETHGVEVVTGTFEELADQGYFTPFHIPAPEDSAVRDRIYYTWPDGCLFSITANSDHEGETHSLPTLFFDVDKWKSPLAAYMLYDCSAVWPEIGTWEDYQIGSEMIS